jgi:hypothetical protein
MCRTLLCITQYVNHLLKSQCSDAHQAVLAALVFFRIAFESLRAFRFGEFPNDSALGQLYLSYAALNQALAGHATEIPSGELDLSSLTPEQRSKAIVCLRAIAEQARALTRGLVTYDAGNEYILATPRDQPDDPQAEKRYMEIAREKAAAHPNLKYVFSAK